jgi:hypothetical protein
VEAVSASTTYVRIAAISLGILAKDPSLRGARSDARVLGETRLRGKFPAIRENNREFLQKLGRLAKSRPSERSKLS